MLAHQMVAIATREEWINWNAERLVEALRKVYPIETTTRFQPSDTRWAEVACCQVMSRLKILIKMHPFTFVSYNPFYSLHIDHIGPLTPDEKGNTHILVMIDAFSRWVALFP